MTPARRLFDVVPDHEARQIAPLVSTDAQVEAVTVLLDAGTSVDVISRAMAAGHSLAAVVELLPGSD